MSLLRRALRSLATKQPTQRVHDPPLDDSSGVLANASVCVELYRTRGGLSKDERPFVRFRRAQAQMSKRRSCDCSAPSSDVTGGVVKTQKNLSLPRRARCPLTVWSKKRLHDPLLDDLAPVLQRTNVAVSSLVGRSSFCRETTARVSNPPSAPPASPAGHLFLQFPIS